MFQLENLETIRPKYEGMSRGFLNWHNIVPRTCRWEIRCQIFQNCPMPPPLWVKTLIDLCPCIIAKSHLELLGQFHERDAGFEKLLAKAVLNEHSPLKLSVLSFNSRRILHVRPCRYEPWIISSCTFCKVYYRSYNFKWKTWTRTSSNIWSGSIISGQP